MREEARNTRQDETNSGLIARAGYRHGFRGRKREGGERAKKGKGEDGPTGRRMENRE